MKINHKCLHCELIKTIVKYGKKHGVDAVCDGNVVEAVAYILADIMSLYKDEAQTDIRKHFSDILDKKLAFLREHVASEQPRTATASHTTH